MEFMIIGGMPEAGGELCDLEKYCKLIGSELRKLGHSIVLCSPFKDSADYWVLRGYVDNEYQTKANIGFFYTDSEIVRAELEIIEKEVNIRKINKFPNPPPIPDNESSFKYTWLLCQLRALDYCHAIIAIGGKTGGSADMLLQFAEQKRKMIIPFSIMEGAAKQSLFRKQFELQDLLRKNYSLLHDKDEFYTLIEKLEKKKETLLMNDKMKFFISYARKRPSEADYIETLLRRRGLQVFRDESDFCAGKEIPVEITENLYSANVFIAVYCSEYVCSPWCFDELEMALDRTQEGSMQLWIFCVDDTRMVPKRARNLLFYNVSKREDIEGILLELLTKPAM